MVTILATCLVQRVKQRSQPTTTRNAFIQRMQNDVEVSLLSTK